MAGRIAEIGEHTIILLSLNIVEFSPVSLLNSTVVIVMSNTNVFLDAFALTVSGIKDMGSRFLTLKGGLSYCHKNIFHILRCKLSKLN